MHLGWHVEHWHLLAHDVYPGEARVVTCWPRQLQPYSQNREQSGGVWLRGCTSCSLAGNTLVRSHLLRP